MRGKELWDYMIGAYMESNKYYKIAKILIAPDKYLFDIEDVEMIVNKYSVL